MDESWAMGTEEAEAEVGQEEETDGDSLSPLLSSFILSPISCLFSSAEDYTTRSESFERSNLPSILATRQPTDLHQSILI
jgi:hypothetical protein